MTPHDVLPGTQNPPPADVVAQTQSEFELLHWMKLAQLDPTHSGCEVCAEAGATEASTIGATYAAPAALSAFLITRRRLSSACVS